MNSNDSVDNLRNKEISESSNIYKNDSDIDENDSDNKNNIEEKMLEEHTYPSPSQENFQEAIYVKRDFYIHKIPERKILTKYDDIKEYRDSKCFGDIRFSGTQVLLSNFINPNTPFRGLLIYAGTGSGKGAVAIAIAEKFKPMVEKYGTRITVLVPGPLIKANFMAEIIKFTGETYLKYYQDKTMILDEAEQSKLRKNAINIINQYYRIMSYRSFYKKVLGEKIREKVVSGDKVKVASRRLESGEYEREISVDRIYNLDNTLLIADEAHNLTGNEFGDAVKKIIATSKNIKVILLSATPMKNLADDIVELLNYLRPPNFPIEREKVFTSQHGYQMDFKPNGREYLRNMCRGYVSYLRGADPLTFAERIDVGEIPPGLDFVKVTRCYMLPFQLKAYEKVIDIKIPDESDDDKNQFLDSLDRSSQAAANFVFPGLSKNKSEKNIEGFIGIDGINDVKLQLKNNSDLICQKIASTILAEYDIKDPSSLLYLTENNKNISGDIFHEKYLKYFSIKFYTALQKINETIYGKRGNGLIFVYSNLVKVGIDVFQEVLRRNGYIEFQENTSNYNIKSSTRCYYCDYVYSNHKNLPNDIPKHDFYPATYVVVTGKSEENAEQIPEEKHRILKNIFNSSENKNGKYIKIVIGSRVMNEGITLKNIKEIHILDVHYNLGKVDQVIGRGIRFCTHYDIIHEDNPFPKVEIYKYVVSLKETHCTKNITNCPGGILLSNEEQMYKKAELKYRVIKETERILQEEAVDCPLNLSGNIFPEELEKYGNCGSKENPCPAICGYMKCQYKCGDAALNAKYYDPSRAIYKKVEKSDLDYSTYSNALASEEIEYAKSIIKEMYRIDHIYNLEEILKYVKKSYSVEKREMFDDYYVYQALDELIPITGNDFNNFHDTLTDKYNRPGYLIYRREDYIFQPFDENELTPIYYRKIFRPPITNKLGLKEYIQGLAEYQHYKEKSDSDSETEENIPTPSKSYDFDSNQEYYDSREEFDFVGTIDQESTRKKVRATNEIKDVFKIREKRSRFLSKKRETGVPSFKGAVCTSKDKKSLISVIKKINLSFGDSMTRMNICAAIKNKLYDLEKYATSKDGNKMTYLIIPANHPDKKYTFPLCLEDRMKLILSNIQRDTRTAIDPVINIIKFKGQFNDINYQKYEIQFDKSMDKYSDVLEKNGAVKDKHGKWTIIID